MFMAENKTKPTEQSVAEFLENVEDKTKREDSFKLVEMMREITGEEPKMWGPTMVGFGTYHYKYESGREGDAMRRMGARLFVPELMGLDLPQWGKP